MASATGSSAARLCLLATRPSAPRLQPPMAQARRGARQTPRTSIGYRRAMSTTRAYRKDETPSTASEEARSSGGTEALQDLPPPPPSEGGSSGISSIDSLNSLRVMDAVAKEHGFTSFDQYVKSSLRQKKRGVMDDRAMESAVQEIFKGGKLNRQHFWFDAEDPEVLTEEHDEFDEDDMTEMAHSKLEEIREMRQYARMAVWELPLLSKFAKPFEPPTDREVLRWRYTTYMGDTHPAEKKVVVQFSPNDLGLTKVQQEKLKKLAGPRYNPENELIRMSCESYAHPAQNKRYLSDLVDDLIAAAKDPKDTFEDVPLDLRHHKAESKPRFPKEWLMTEDRRREIEATRRQNLLEDGKRAEAGLLLDGKQVIDDYLLRKMQEEEEKAKEPELVAAPTGKANRPATWASKSRR